MKTIKIAEHEINVLTKEELLALGYREVEDTYIGNLMRKEYPTGIPFGREVGLVIFYEVPGKTGVYDATNKMMTLFHYIYSWDAGEFLDNAAKAILEYRTDMEKLGIPENPESKEPKGEEE